MPQIESRIPNKSTRCVHCFRETGSVSGKKRSGRPSSLTEVRQCLERSRRKSLRRLSGLSYGTKQRTREPVLPASIMMPYTCFWRPRRNANLSKVLTACTFTFQGLGYRDSLSEDELCSSERRKRERTERDGDPRTQVQQKGARVNM
uniref:Uncharacterized protein n=1 Tax=Timema cristinae TaxID=61476 RepID=A0A7R9GV56_TIMCR|nr:unnamed protein product [Timema cristinae]